MSEDFDPPIKGVVTATGVAVSHGMYTDNPAMAHALVSAMTKAVEKAQAEGVNDPDAVRERIHQARDTAFDAVKFTDEVNRKIQEARERGEIP